MSAPGERSPTIEAKLSKAVADETAITIKDSENTDKDKTEKLEKAPVSNFWVSGFSLATKHILTVSPAYPFASNDHRWRVTPCWSANRSGSRDGKTSSSALQKLS